LWSEISFDLLEESRAMTLLTPAGTKHTLRLGLRLAYGALALGLALHCNGQTPPAPSTSAPAAGAAANPSTSSPQAPQAADSTAEVSTRDNPVTFQERVNLVTVQVVVRDARGAVITNLKKEDFRLFDKGKPQAISRFTIERPGALVAAATPASKNPLEAEEQKSQPAPASLPTVATRFVVYQFDDLHLGQNDLMLSRAAAGKHIDKSLHKTDRAAIYTSSGQTQQDFTDDLSLLHQALDRLRPRSQVEPGGVECPNVSYYMADLIINKNDPQALTAAALEAIDCMALDPSSQMDLATTSAKVAAQRQLSIGEQESRLALLALRNTIHRLSAMPGERVIVLVSPGFLTLDTHRQDLTEVVDLANRSKVVINTLDARGLYTDPVADASRFTQTSNTLSIITSMQYLRLSATVEGDVLGEIADGTAGAWYHNNNDLEGGFNKIATTPEVIYVLGFSPENLKYDGSYHKLKVSLANDRGLTLQARRGYFAPRHMANPAEQAKQEIHEAVFSRDPLSDMPVAVRTQFYKTGDTQAKLSVATRIDIRKLPFRKENGRNVDNLTIVTALFDRNGNFLQAIGKTLDMKLRDTTLATRLDGGISVRVDFDVTRGGYLIRSVVRDTEGQLMGAENGSVEIP
jgi:VWFA-related protein